MPLCFAVHGWYITPPQVNSLPHLPSEAVLGSGSDLGSIAARTALVFLVLMFKHEGLLSLCSVTFCVIYPPCIEVSGCLTMVHRFSVIRA